MKNFEIYYNKLIDYCRLSNLNVYFLENPKNDFPYYSPNHRAIYLPKELDNVKSKMKPYVIAVFLHEIGHFMDDLAHDFKEDKLYFSCIKKVDKEQSISKEEYLAVVKGEKKAWAWGKRIAFKLKIPLGKWYRKHKKDGMGYYSTFQGFIE